MVNGFKTANLLLWFSLSVRLKEFSIIVLIIFLTFLRWEFCLECRLFIWKTFLSYLDFNIENRVTYGKPYICYKNFFFYIFEYFFHPTLFVYIVVFLSQKSFYFTPVPDLFSSSSVWLSLCLSVFFCGLLSWYPFIFVTVWREQI